ncbi:hypothetical protein JRQ81_001845 [Phrynocephalus forsythii]|uniref:Uncharacterized protein n=1 Tax=Phrynocephalus forsythii TaxID=171643 RepID=A0A9Q0Y824_9SAUR|nr:hypothetical protein JRQ81_001845 [Phrynocephalus forsythii]
MTAPTSTMPTTQASCSDLTSVFIPRPHLPTFSLHFNGTQWVFHTVLDSTSLKQQQLSTSSPPLDPEDSSPPFEEETGDGPQLVTAPHSDIEEHTSPSSSESMRNYSNFILCMKLVDLPVHHPKPCHTDLLYGNISSEDFASVHLGVIPSFLSMAEGSFKNISSQSVSRMTESLYKVFDDKAPFLVKHPHPNSVVIAASQVQSRTKQVPIPPSKEGRKLDSVGVQNI